MKTLFQSAAALLAVFGLSVLALGVLLSVPLTRPPTLASIQAGAAAIDPADKPALSRYQARDGTWLAYRLYPASGAPTDRVAILAHGSSALSDEMNPLGKALAAAGVTAVALDVRGHGASGTRGDLAYAGQLEDDLADLLAQLRQTRPNAKFLMIGHSLGGGFLARLAATPIADSFERFVLLAPFLGPDAPTSRDGNRAWATADVPRIVALSILRRLGLPFAESLPVIAYANDPQARAVTSVYSFRLLFDYGPEFDWERMKADLRAASAKTIVIAGADDELMDAAAYRRELPPLGVSVTIAPGVDHMGVVYAPAALAAVVAAAKGERI